MLRRLAIILVVLMLLTGCGGREAINVGEPVQEVLDNSLEETNHEGEEAAAEADEPVEPEDDADQSLAGLPIEEFFAQAFNQMLARDPETVVELGIKELAGDEPVLTEVSPEALAADNLLYQDLLALLQAYDYAALDQSDQISYQVFEWSLLDQIQDYEDRAFDYLVNPVSVRSEPQLYVMFFTESHPFNTAQDAHDYVARVRLLDEKIDQLIDRIEEQKAAGVIPPKIVLQYGRSDFKRAIGPNAHASPLQSAFRSKAGVIPDLDTETFNTLEQQLEQALMDEVYPAFDRLDDLLQELESQAPQVLGLSALPGGEAYYQRQLHHFTTTDMTAEEIHALGLAEVERIQGEMRARFTALDYPEDESIDALYDRLASDSGALRGQAITAEYERILAEADQLVADYFTQRPVGELEVVGGDAGAFYSPGSLDGSRPGRFYTRITSPEPLYQMRSLAYHEGIPGHHYQITLAAMADLPLFRNLFGFTGYAEGWALYAEYLAYDLGWYDDDPYGDLGRLQYEALRACRLVVDTGIHTMGWDYDQAVDYMVENTGFERGFMEYEVMRYISYPAQATAYMVGKSEILRLRSVAQDALGDDFVLSDFHAVILENGSMPLGVLEEVIDDWIAEKLQD